MEDHDNSSNLLDTNQNYWQLGSIQASASGIPVIIIGTKVANDYGIGTGITSVIIGNMILWIIGMAIISMSLSKRNNALQNIYVYLGKTGSVLSALFLILAFISWYTLQINTATLAISNLVPLGSLLLQLGAFFGAFISLLSIGGIYLIKKYCTFIFPFLIAFCIYSLIILPTNLLGELTFSFSIFGIFAVISSNLAGIVNLPTFFRHSRSQSDSFLGLSVMIVFTIFFQITSIITNFITTKQTISPDATYSILLIVFILLSLISINIVNIYFASAGWEMVFPHRKSNKEFVIIGLLGTLAYTFFQITTPMQFILDMAENFIASLGIVLVLSFLMKTFEHHRPRRLEKSINLGCWFFGAVIGTLSTWKGNIGSPQTLITSFCATTLAFLVIIYLGETYWSAKKIVLERNHE